MSIDFFMHPKIYFFLSIRHAEKTQVKGRKRWFTDSMNSVSYRLGFDAWGTHQLLRRLIKSSRNQRYEMREVYLCEAQFTEIHISMHSLSGLHKDRLDPHRTKGSLAVVAYDSPYKCIGLMSCLDLNYISFFRYYLGILSINQWINQLASDILN